MYCVSVRKSGGKHPRNVVLPVCTNFFQIMFRSFSRSILFCSIVLFSYESQRGKDRKTGKGNGNGKSPPKKKYQTKKKAYTKWYVPLKEDPQPERLRRARLSDLRGASHKQKDLNKWPEQNMLPGTFMFWSSCSSSCPPCSFSCSNSLLCLDITAYVLQTIFNIITSTVTCFHLSFYHRYSI